MRISIYHFVGILFFFNFANPSIIKEITSVKDDLTHDTVRFHSDGYKTTLSNNNAKPATFVSSACPQYTCPGTAGCTYIISGADATTYNVYSGEKICLEPGADFTGLVGFYGGEMQNCATAPQDFTYFIDDSSPQSTFNNYGNFTVTNSPAIQDSLLINNYGIFSLYNLTVGLDAVFNNYCTTTVNNNFYISSTGNFNNYGNMDISLNLTLDINGYLGVTGGCITSNQMFNEGIIEGLSCGNITINTSTNNTSTGSIIGDIALIDLTPPGSAPFIDTNNGTIGGSVVWTSCTNCSLILEEICNNGIDDDGDGYIDADDPDCIVAGSCGCPPGGTSYATISAGHIVPAGAIHCLTGDVDLTNSWGNLDLNGSLYIINGAHLDIDGGMDFGDDANLIVCEGASFVHDETGPDYPNNIYNFGWLQICGTVTTVDSIIVGENSLTALKGNGLNFDELSYVGDPANNAYLFFDIATTLNGSSGTICLPGGTPEMIVEIDAVGTTPDCVNDCNGCPELSSITETCNDGTVEAAYLALNPTVEEICGNGIDDNGDGRIDEAYPGGVQTNLQLWLNAGEGASSEVNGTDVTSWADQSTNSYSADADVKSTDNPTYEENAINYHPGINFDGAYSDIYSDGLHLGSDYIYSENDGMQIFSVVEHAPTGNSFANIYDFGHGNNEVVGLNWTHIYSKNQTPTAHGGADVSFFHHTGSLPVLVGFEIDFETDQTLLKNGTAIQNTLIPGLSQITANEIAEVDTFGNVAAGPVTIGRQSSSFALSQSRIFNGAISEVLVYNDTLSQSDQEKINSYLAVKYGLSLSHNYYFSDGTLIKDITDGYANNIAGIALDSCGALIQKQSQSVGDSAIISIAHAAFATTNEANTSTFIADKSALIWGHNGAAENTNWNGTNYDIPNGGYLGIDRVWKFNETQDVQNVVLRVDVDNPDFDLPVLNPFPGSDGAYHLFLDDDGDFTNGGTTVQKMTLVSGSIWETTIADPTTSYFSIGSKVPEICNDGVDNDLDGDIDCLDSDCNTTYYAISQTNSSVLLPSNILGAPDGQLAFFGNAAEMIIDLGSALDIGEDYTLSLRYISTASNMIIEESIDGVNFFPATNSPYSIPSSTLTDAVFTTSVHTRYLRLSFSSGSFAVDAVTYGNCLCQPATTMTEEYSINGATHVTGTNVTVTQGDNLRLEFAGTAYNTWTFIWTGPNSFYRVTDAGSNRDRLVLNDIQVNQAGEYKVVYFDDVGCVDSTSFFVTVDPLVEICNNGVDDDGDGFIDCADPDCSAFDTDGDLVCDYFDLDNDDDGIPDIEEGCGVTTDIPGTIGISNTVTNTIYSLNGTDITYTHSGSAPADVIGYDGLLQGPVISIHTLTISDGTLSFDFSNTIGSVNFKITDFDGFEDITVNVYDENNMLYDLTVEGVVSIGSLIEQTGNQFVALTSHTAGGVNVDGNDPADDHLGTVSFYLKGSVSRIDFIYVQIEDSSLRISQPTFCTGDTDGDNVFNNYDLDSDNDGVYDLEEAGHGVLDGGADGVLDGSPSDFGSNGLLDALETVADNGILNYTIADSETTPDGIYDAYEIDADGDTCFDALEEGVTDGDGDGIAGTGTPSVNLEGLVNGITYATPSNANWQNPATGICLPEICNNGIDDDGDGLIDCEDSDCSAFDTDGDLICNAVDLDDDNDGIPDVEEGCVPDTILVWNELTPAFTNVSNGSPSADQTVTYTNEDGDFDYTFEVDNPADNYFNQFSIGDYHALGVNANALDSVGDFAELTINLDNVPAGVTLQEILFTIDDIDRGGHTNTREVVTVVGFDGATAISPTVTAQQTGFLVINPPAPDNSVTTTTTTSGNLPFLPGDSNAAGTAEQAAIDISFTQTIDRIVIRYSQTGQISAGGLGIRQFMGTYCKDSDGDGVVNSLDLDSDNDGIYDLDEAGHSEADADTDGMIDGVPSTFGTNGLFDGLETVADNGLLNYTIADSETTPDGIYDAYEIDADGDGCFDTVEAIRFDSEQDGIAGTGVPLPTAFGLVTGLPYNTPPPNADWQNPAVATCIPTCDAEAPTITKD